jgi:hypothetical protein
LVVFLVVFCYFVVLVLLSLPLHSTGDEVETYEMCARNDAIDGTKICQFLQ